MDTGALSQQISSDVASDRGVGTVSGNMQLGPKKITLPIDLLLREVRLSFESISSVTSARCSILWEEDGISCSKLTKSQVRYLYSFHHVSQINKELQFSIFFSPMHGLMLSSGRNNPIPQPQFPNSQILKFHFGLNQFKECISCIN